MKIHKPVLKMLWVGLTHSLSKERVRSDVKRLKNRLHIRTFGANDEVAPTSPPTALSLMILISVGSNFGGILHTYVCK